MFSLKWLVLDSDLYSSCNYKENLCFELEKIKCFYIYLKGWNIGSVMHWLWAHTKVAHILFIFVVNKWFCVINCLDSVQLYRCKYDECDVFCLGSFFSCKLVNNWVYGVNCFIEMLQMTKLCCKFMKITPTTAINLDYLISTHLTRCLNILDFRIYTRCALLSNSILLKMFSRQNILTPKWRSLWEFFFVIKFLHHRFLLTGHWWLYY